MLFLLTQIQFTNAQVELGIIPIPKTLAENGSYYNLTTTSRIVYTNAALQPLANILKEDIAKITGLNLSVTSGGGGNGDIELHLNGGLPDEGYTLNINSKIVITGKDYRATVWGTSTLLQSINRNGSVKQISVNDSPDTGYRGLMVDLARQFHPVQNLEDIINLCRLYKINYLHLHFMDTQFFTFPSQAYPLLTSPGNSYTLAEVHALEAYSQARGVTIVPELEVPGHATRMIQTYPDLFGSGTDGAINIARADVRAAVGTLINEIADVFQATPYFHIGCDEVDKSGMGQHPDYINAIAQLGVGDVNGLFNYFIDEVTGYVEARGKRAMAWEGFDSGRTGAAEVSKNLIVCPFDNYTNANTYAGNGHDILNTSWFPLYLVPDTYIPPSKIYDWEVNEFGNYASAFPRSHNNVNQYFMQNTGKLIGAQTCSWEQKAEFEIPSLRSRVCPMSERIWNTNAGRTYDDYRARFEKSDQVLTDILATAVPQAITPSVSFDIFTDKLAVRWRAEDGYPNSFTLYRNTSDNSATATPILTNTTLTSYDDTNTSNGQTYYYWIKAHNALGTSAFGNSAEGRRGNSSLVSMYEPFDYGGNSNPNGLNGGTGFNGSWNVTENGGAVVISGAGLSYPNLQTSGNSLNTNMLNATQPFNIERSLAGNLCPEGSEVWVSLLVKPNSLDSGHAFFGIGNAFIGKVWGNGISFSGINAQLALENGVTSLLVLKIESLNGNDNVHIWTNPVVNGIEPGTNSPNHYFTDRTDVGTSPKIGINVQHHNGGGNYEFDELRIGDSFDDVLPVTGSCLNTIICYANVNGQGWQQTCDAELSGGQSVTFGPQLTNNTTGSWSWAGPGGFTSGSREITVSTPGTYVVTFTGADACVINQNIVVTSSGCTNSGPTNHCQYTTDNASYINGCDITVNEGEQLIYTYSGCDANLTLNLTGPNGFNQNSAGACGEILVSNSITPNMSGRYTATLTDNTTGCSTPQTVTINVLENDCSGAIICYANVNNKGWQQICDVELFGGQSIAFGPQLNYNNNQGAWSWTGPEGFTSGSREITVSNPGSYTVAFTGVDGCIISENIIVTYSGEAISGTVWVDTNADGIRNPGEAGIPNVTVRLFFDNNNDNFVERIISTVQSNQNGEYTFSFPASGKYQVGIDPLSLPEDKYRLTEQDALGNEALDNDVSPHTFRTDIFESNPGNIDIGILQGTGELIFIGNGETAGQPTHRWIYQDIHLMIQDTGVDPNDAGYRAIVKQWMKWYATGERITQEAEVLPGYLNYARHNHLLEADVSVKHFHTVNGLGSYASGRGAVSSGIPATTLLNNPNVVVDHILMFYETTRGANPIWKYRANWPFGGRLTHHALTSMTLKELGGTNALWEVPNVTSWNPGRDHLNELSRWESAGMTFAQGFPIDRNSIEGDYEFVNQTSIPFPNPDNPAQMTTVTSRGIQTAIIIKILADMGREKAIEALHNMSAKSWYSPSQDQALIHFKQAVNDATDGLYNNNFSQLWGFPADNTYNNTRTVNSGSFTNKQAYKWDLKPHNYDAAKIRLDYDHLSDRTTQGYAKWIDADGSSYKNLGAIDYLAPQGSITYPNEDAHLVIGEGVSFAHQLANGEWELELEVVQGNAADISFPDGELLSLNGNLFTLLIEDGELNMDFDAQIRLAELTLRTSGVTSDGNGLSAVYYDNMDFTGNTFNRIDEIIDFNWGLGSPDASIANDTYSARWTGYVEAPTSGNYTFFTNTDDGVRLWVNDQLIIDKWVNQSPREWSGAINMTAGQKVAIKMEYYENGGGAVARLMWQGPGVGKQIILSNYLFSDSDNECENVALGKNTSQSSNYESFTSNRANNGNTNGTDFTHTRYEAEAWWEIDLGATYSIQDIKIFNRTDCCSQRLNNFHLFVSDTPFSSKSLSTTLNQSGVSNYYFNGAASAVEDFNIDRSGRYVRVQLSGINFLQLSEVQVFACTEVDQQDCNFNQLSGAALDVGAGGGKTFIVGTDRRVYEWNGYGWNIQPEGPQANRIDVEASGVPWIVATDGKIYRLVDNQWQNIAGWASDVGCGANQVYVVGGANRIYKWNGGNSWTGLPNSAGVRIDVHGDGGPWIVGTNGLVYQYISGNWYSKGSFTAKDISIQEGDQYVWALASPNSEVTRYRGNNVWETEPGLAEHISVNSNGDVWVVNVYQQIFVNSCIANARLASEISLNNTLFDNIAFPNPATEQLYLKLDPYYLNKNLDYVITNVKGQLVDRGIFNPIYNNVVEVDVSSAKFQAGTYFITLATGDTRQVIKFVVMK